MMNLFRRLFGHAESPATAAPDPDAAIARAGGAQLDMSTVCTWHDGLPHPDWAAVHGWLDTLAEAERPGAWTACERAWLGYLAASLGEGYRRHESESAFVVSRQPPREAAATLAYVGTTLRRVQHLLEELAVPAAGGKEILIVFADTDDYYRYVGYFSPDEDEVAMSAGMFLHGPCAHFILHGEDIARFEPTIVHEMTHSQLSHLPLPAWLNEGMAVNSEQRLTRIGADIWSVLQLEGKHREFWNAETIQEFWNGKAFLRPDQGSELAYDLGRILVNGLSSEWAAFKRFASHAIADDGGSAAAARYMHVDLGEFVRNFLGRDDDGWGPRPSSWEQTPERGAFHPESRAG